MYLNVFFFLVNFPIVATGVALILAAGTTAVSLTPLLGAAGLLGIGVGGSMLAQSVCVGPIYCRTTGGQCCILTRNNDRVICPEFC